MALPGMPYKNRDGMEKRASARNVARYYEDYVEKMNLSNNFKCGVVVTKVVRLNEDVIMKEIDDEKILDDRIIDDERFNEVLLLNERKETEIKREKTCKLSSALNFIISRAQQRYRSDRCCKRRRESKHDLSPTRKMRELSDHGEIIKLHDINTHRIQRKFNKFRNKERSISMCSESSNINDNLNFNECDSFNQYSKSVSNSDYQFLNYNDKLEQSLDKVPVNFVNNKLNRANWFIEAYDIKTRTRIAFTCNNLVLANGSSDLPNKLEISNINNDPDWLLHDVRSLEIELDLYIQDCSNNINPVIIVGAGLSSADAVITARARNVPVIHVFRNLSNDLGKQLPENMYPEYHKVSF